MTSIHKSNCAWVNEQCDLIPSLDTCEFEYIRKTAKQSATQAEGKPL